MTQVRTRYAPSPTGYLHVGGAWTAFFNWLFARHEGGVFVVRIEDTDRTRSTQEYEAAIFEDFRWLGLEWQEGPDIGGPYGPYRQTERAGFYQQYASELLARGAAYHCYCTPEELEAERQRAAAAHQPYRYSGRCRDLSPADRAAFEAQGRKPTIRLRIRGLTEKIVIHDLVRGRVEFDPADLDDSIIVRSDGSALYNFANVVDDHLMAITHAVRGNEHLTNTPRQWVIYRALGWTPPAFAHLPSILGADRKKLSKRLGDVAVRDYRREGYLPEALLNFFALMAWHPEGDREIYSVDELVREFRLEDLGKSGAIFDPAKLLWINGVYMRDLVRRDPGRVVELCLESLRAGHLVNGEASPTLRAYIADVVAALGDRLKVGRDIVGYGAFFFADQVNYEPDAARQYLATGTAATLLAHLRESLATAATFDRTSIEHLVRQLAVDLKVSTGEIIHPARVALTGKTVGPGLFELMAVLGRDQVLARLNRAIQWMHSQTV